MTVQQSDSQLPITAPPMPGEAPPTVVIRASSGWASLGLGDLWQFRELLYFTVWRDIKGRYRQMALGPLWVILQPLIQMVIFSFLFGTIAKLPSEGIPYPVFTFVALLPWSFFASSVRSSTNSLVSQQHIIAKVYFPRLIIPISTVLAALIDFVASFLILLGMMLIFQVWPTWRFLTLPFFLLLAAMTALAIGLWLASLAVKYRDVSIGVNFGVEILKYLTPVAYSATLIPEQWQTLYRLNPMTAVVEGFRWALLGVGDPWQWTTLVSMLGVVVLLVSGAYYFRRTERTIVDQI